MYTSFSSAACPVVTGIITSSAFSIDSLCIHLVPLHLFFKTVLCEHLFSTSSIIQVEQMFVNRFRHIFRTYFLNICLRFPISCVIIKYIIINEFTIHLKEDIIWRRGKITAKQEEILEYIKSQILERGFPPSVRDICEAVHLKSTSSVHSHLETLEKNGYIRRDPTKPRAIEILDDSFNFNRREMVNVPVIGHVAAGEPLLAEQNIENYFPIPMEYMPNKQTFMLKVHGESMINAGILDGDFVLVEQSAVADNGDIVVALLEDSATVKRFYKEEGIFRLQPENDALEPIIVRDLQIMGKVIGVFRFF